VETVEKVFYIIVAKHAVYAYRIRRKGQTPQSAQEGEEGNG
jgi:hypothetical protein